MSRVVVVAGSNIRPAENLAAVAALLGRRASVLAEAPARATAPFGPPGQPLFWNAGFLIETELDAAALKTWLRELEAERGRVRTADRYAPRTLDLDEIARDGRVTDPDVTERAYLREILAELTDRAV